MGRQASSIIRRLGWLAVLLAGGGWTGAAETAADNLEQTHRELRKAFLVAQALPPTSPKLRPEHLAFLQNSSRHLATLQADDLRHRPFLLATQAARGMLLLHCGQLAKARDDFDAALALYGDAPAAGQPEPWTVPLGTPNRATLRLYRAFTFVDAGPEAFINEVNALPETDFATGAEVLRERIAALAEHLAARQRHDEAIAVYGIIKKHGLWDEDRDRDPQRMIELLEIQKTNRMGGQ